MRWAFLPTLARTYWIVGGPALLVSQALIVTARRAPSLLSKTLWDPHDRNVPARAIVFSLRHGDEAAVV